MRRSIALFAFIASLVMAAAGFAQAADPPASSSIKGLFLITDYPSQTVRAGEITTIRVKLTNSGLPPEPVALSLSDVPAGWKVDILGGGQSVASAMPGINQDISLQLRVDVPKDAKPGSQKVVLSAKGPLTQAPDLVFTLTVGTETPAKLSLKSRLPSLRGTPRSAFEYTVTVGNDSGKDLTVALSAQAPGQLPDHLHRRLRLQRDQLDSDRGRPDQGHQGQGDAAARCEGGRLPGAGQGRVRGCDGRAQGHVADQRPGQAGALDQGRPPVAARPKSARPAAYTLVVEQRRHRADRGSRDVGHRAGQLEGRVQSQDHPERWRPTRRRRCRSW